MTPQTVLTDLWSRGVVIAPADNEISLRAPTGILGDQDVVFIRNHKREILGLLRLLDGLPVDEEASALLAMEELDAEEVPACPDCNRLCNVQTLDDAWCCSKCDPRATDRRQRTQRFMQALKTIRYTQSLRGEGNSSDANGRSLPSRVGR